MNPNIITFDEWSAYMNGRPFNPRDANLANTFAYYVTETVKTQLILEDYLMDDDDCAYMSRNGMSRSYTYKTANGAPFRVYPISVWKAVADENEAFQLIAKMNDAAQSAGLDFTPTVATMAGRICRKNTETKQLEPRWRDLAHAAIHQGPMVVVNGGRPDTVGMDREKAFLRAMYERMPTGPWIATSPRTIDYMRDYKGIVRATLRVDKSRYTQHIPCLPVKYSGYTVYPTGLVRGVWTLDMLWDAVDNGGYEIDTIHELIVSKSAPVHAKAADFIASIQDKELRKLLYTRYWGRMASVGGFNGYVTRKWDKPKRVIGSKLFWYYMGKSPMSHAAPDYRPDHAAFIASANHLEMNRALRKYQRGTVVATHIDCIWTTDKSVDPGDSFREKHSGDSRFYGVGCYNVGGNLAAQGFKGKLTTESLEKWGSELSCGHGIYRDWQGNPAKEQSAVSDPPHHTESHVIAEPPIRNVPELYDAGWTSRGWYRENKQTEQTDV